MSLTYEHLSGSRNEASPPGEPVLSRQLEETLDSV